MRILCLDIGDRRTGVAVSDPLDLTAQGLETIHHVSAEADLARVEALCRQYDTKRILCGLPKNMDGSEGGQALHSRKFAERLTQRGYEVRFQDERLTTVIAQRVLSEGGVRPDKRKQVVDKLAAVHILQTFLDGGGWKDKKYFYKSEVWYMNEEMMDMELDAENIVELVDEDGQVVRFEHLMSFEHKGKIYICLSALDEVEDIDEDELVIMRIEKDEEGNDYYTTIDNEDELNEAYEKYLELAEEDEDEDEDE